MSMITLKAPEVRTFSALQLREVETSASGRWLEGRAVPYGEWADVGWYREQHEAGSFETSIKQAAKGLPLLLWHDSRTFPVGVSDEWRDNKAGLDCVWRMDDSTEAERAVELAGKGMLTGLSIGFAPIRSEWDMVEDWDPDKGPEHMDAVTRLESRLLEVSLTPTPAFAGAQVSLVRSRERGPHGQPRQRQASRPPRLAEWQDIAAGLRR